MKKTMVIGGMLFFATLVPVCLAGADATTNTSGAAGTQTFDQLVEGTGAVRNLEDRLEQLDKRTQAHVTTDIKQVLAERVGCVSVGVLLAYLLVLL